MNTFFKYLIFMIFYTLSISLMFSQTITKENIESAEKIVGLEFNDEERDS